MKITAPQFTDPDKAREHLEALRWPNGPVCPHCGSDKATRLQGSKARPGTIQCNACRRQFTVTVGTVFERSKVPLHQWLLATHLMCASKKGISAHQIHRMFGVTYKTAWFMAHRIREAMRSDDLTPLGSDGGVVEADETFIGVRKGAVRQPSGSSHKMKVLSLIDRNSGSSRSFVIDGLGVKDIAPIIGENLSREAFLMTDEWRTYRAIAWNFSGHGTVKHLAGEYVVPGSSHLHTNTVEGFFSIFKRGMKGVYQHCREKHLHRYLAEFDFRYTNRAANGVDDTARTDTALKGIAGRRLMYRRACVAA